MNSTPKKQYSRGVIVPNVGLCVLCSTVNKQKYRIFNCDGSSGAGRRLAQCFLEVNFSTQRENFGAYVCVNCRKLIEQYINYQNKVQSIFSRLELSRQQIETVSSNKRVTPGKTTCSPKCVKKSRNRTASTTPQKAGANRNTSPSTPQKSATPTKWKCSPRGSGKKNLGKGMRPSPKKQLSFSSPTASFCPPESSTPQGSTLFSQSTHSILSEDLENTIEVASYAEITELSTSSQLEEKSSVNSGKVNFRNQKKKLKREKQTSQRSKTIQFRTVKIANEMYPIAFSLKDGSVHQALKKIHAEHPQTFQNFVSLIVKEESQAMSRHSKSYTHRDTSAEDIENINLDKMAKQIKQICPLSWMVTCTVASNYYRKYKFKKRFVLTAFLILLSSRSQNINSFQMANALAMYRFDINKEGIEFLCSLGVTVSHTSLHRKLKAIEQKTVSDLHALKLGLEKNLSVVCLRFNILHDRQKFLFS